MGKFRPNLPQRMNQMGLVRRQITRDRCTVMIDGEGYRGWMGVRGAPKSQEPRATGKGKNRLST
jgi:hypothetical protein